MKVFCYSLFCTCETIIRLYYHDTLILKKFSVLQKNRQITDWEEVSANHTSDKGTWIQNNSQSSIINFFKGGRGEEEQLEQKLYQR